MKLFRLTLALLITCALASAQITIVKAPFGPSNVSATFTTATSVTITHNLNTLETIAHCETTAGATIAITGVTRTTNSITPTFASSTGKCIVNGTGGVGPAGATGSNGANGTTGSNGTNGAISVIQEEGVDLAVEGKLNFIGGGVTCVRNIGVSIDCTFTGTGGGSSAFTTTTFSATPTFTVTASTTIHNFKETLTANVTSSTLVLTSATTGQDISFQICQDATGSRTFVWPTNVQGAATISATASSCSNQSFRYDGANAVAITGMSVTGGTQGITIPGSTSGSNTITPAAVAGTGSTTYLPSGASVAVLPDTGAANNFLTGISATGVVTKGQPSSANLSDTANIPLLNATNAWTGRQNATGAASTAPIKSGTSIPGTCTVGDLFFKTDATAGQNIYECATTNTYTQQTGSSSSVLSYSTGFKEVIVGTTATALCSLSIPGNTLLAGGATNGHGITISFSGKNNSTAHSVQWAIAFGSESLDLYASAISGAGRVFGNFLLSNDDGLTGNQAMVLLSGEASIISNVGTTPWEPAQDTTATKVVSVTARTDAGTDTIRIYGCKFQL